MNAALQSYGGVQPPILIGVGGLAWSGDPAVTYSTLLGSCIAVCLWDPMTRRGGMIHFLLAEAPGPNSNDTRYGAVALPALYNNLCAVGCRKENLKAVVAGGADLLANMKPIGTENKQFAFHWLRTEGLALEMQDTGGASARRVRFTPSTGDYQISVINAPVPDIPIKSTVTAVR